MAESSEIDDFCPRALRTKTCLFHVVTLSLIRADGSYILEYNDKNTQYFSSTDGPTVYNVLDGATGFENPAVQEAYFAMQNAFQNSPFMPGTSSFWLRDFLSYAGEEGLDISESVAFYT